MHSLATVYYIITVPFALLHQMTLLMLPMQMVIKAYTAFFWTLPLFLVGLAGMYFFWWKPLMKKAPETPLPVVAASPESV